MNRINTAGGIKGFQVELELQDDQCKGDAATTVAQKFASEPNLVAVVGHVCSGATIPASDVYEKARIPIVSGSATANAVTNRGLDIVNRIAFNDDDQAIGDAVYMQKTLNATKIAVFDDNQSYGKGLANKLATDFTALGGTVTDAESIDPEAKGLPLGTHQAARQPARCAVLRWVSRSGSAIHSADARTRPDQDRLLQR